MSNQVEIIYSSGRNSKETGEIIRISPRKSARGIRPLAVSISRLYKMTEKRQTSQGYIFGILQYFATKLWNINNFVMLFQAAMKFLSRLVRIKILSITQVVNS